MLAFPTSSPPELADTIGGLADATGAGALPEAARPLVAVAIAVAAATAITLVLAVVIGRILRDHPALRTDINRARLPFLLVLALAGSTTALQATAQDTGWHDVVNFLLLCALIGSFAWLITVLLHLLESALLAKYRKDLPNQRRMAKLRTQVTLLRRVAIAVVITLAVAGILLLIPQVRALGAGILASAGLISVVAGLAVQGTLSNVFAGLQIAFTDAIRVDDTVFVEGQQGNIEEITLTYVVVTMPDERRMILPSTHFTTQPFENWSRGTSDISGTVVLDLNWTAPVERLRTRLQQVLDATDLWDGRSGVLNVVNAVGGILQVSIFVSARNPGDLWSLKNHVRERLVHEIQEKYPDALPAPVGQRPLA
ncbi:mechanosensitive ion channel family protein [Arthrobacter sp. KK5.5]|uniref:mechanosensitive ion channel family protein n=1 Tax=Arthrobacter sp. KK5.5 TaxID=3373084 RepID=UPI003EE6D7BE